MFPTTTIFSKTGSLLTLHLLGTTSKHFSQMVKTELKKIRKGAEKLDGVTSMAERKLALELLNSLNMDLDEDDIEQPQIRSKVARNETGKQFEASVVPILSDLLFVDYCQISVAELIFSNQEKHFTDEETIRGTFKSNMSLFVVPCISSTVVDCIFYSCFHGDEKGIAKPAMAVMKTIFIRKVSTRHGLLSCNNFCSS